MSFKDMGDPSATGFFDYDRTSSGSTYHERMVRRASRTRMIVAIAVVLAIVLAAVCAIAALSR